MYDFYMLIVFLCLSIAAFATGLTLTAVCKYVVLSASGIALLFTLCMCGAEIKFRWENRPRPKHKRKTAKKESSSHKIVALVVLEVLAGAAMGILYTNGVVLNSTVVIAIIIIVAIVSLLY